MNDVVYGYGTPRGFYTVTFRNENGTVLTRGFSSPFLAKKFAETVRRSKKCRLIAYPS